MTRLRPLALLAALTLLCCLLLPQPARASEEIVSFHADIQVLPDGALEVTETIDYRLGAGLTKRGIFRDFPLTSPTASGGRAPVTFALRSVTRNGRAEPYTLLRENGHTRVRIGVADIFLPAPSEQSYQLRYRTEGQLRAFQDYDELYWNVTGNRWAFPIARASASVRLPDGAEILQHAAYTGRTGAQGRSFEVTDSAGGLFRARTTAALRPGEGFTVAVAWPKGLVSVTAPREFLGLSESQLAAVAGTLLGTLALFVCWLMVGRDPKGGAIYPQFEPPANLGPAAARYVQELGFDNRTLTAAIVSMAVKGALRIVEEGERGFFKSHSFFLEPLGATGKDLTPAELAAYRKIFSSGGRLELTGDKTNGARMDKARKALKSRLKEEHYGASFLRNTAYTLAGAAAGILAAALLLLLVWQDVPSAFDRLGQWLIAGAGAGFVGLAVSGLLSTPVSLPRSLGKLGGALLFVIPFGIGLFVGAQGLFAEWQSRAAGGIDVVLLGSGAVFGFLIALFHLMMAVPTKAGRRLMDQIEGFALYLKTAEEGRLNILNPPKRTPALFEQLLPYAIALGVSHEWSAKFAGVLSATTMPDWYRSSYGGSGRFDADRFESDLGGAVASTSKPSSGSGSGGGGFSGGGGGGGGGGSW